MDAITDAKAKLANNGIRSGSQYLEGLRDSRDVWMSGKQVTDVTSEPGLERGAKTLADFMSRQSEEKYRDTVTFEDEDGNRCAMAFLKPKSKEDIKRRGASYYEWAKWSNGMFGRTPDYKNASLMSFATATDFLAQGTKGRTNFAENMTNYFEHVRKNDLVLTHTLVNPTVNHLDRDKGRFDDEVALHVVDENDDGITVRGARLLATLGPLADEIEVFPSTVLRSADENIPFAFAFAIPVATKGMKFLCRDSYDHGKSNFDAPLASRYEEMDSVVVFDDVHVPWERIFMYGQPELCNQAFAATNAVVHMSHQVACGKLAKAEFLVGIMAKIATLSNRDKDMFTKGLISEAMCMVETVRALLFAAEEQAHEDQNGNFVPAMGPLDTSRNMFPKMYPRMVEILQILGASSLMATPAEADFSNALAADVEKYFQLSNADARERTSLFRLAHDVCISGFGNRQALYERYFFGPPALMASAYYDKFDKDNVIARVDALLAE